MKRILLLLLFSFNCLLFSGQKLSIDGKISNFENKPVENASIRLIKQKDSSIISSTLTNKEGNFSLKINELNEPSILKAEADKLLPYSKNFDRINASLRLEEIRLDKDKISDIEEVVITASPIKIKKDTIEFNANAIKVRPDSNIQELLKSIDGIEVDSDGKITVNGKEVDQIMINGKPFFDATGKIALENIPADIIKNIQVTSTKTKEEELTGKTPKSEKSTINFNIDEKKNQGFISRITGGYGSDKRYEASGFLSYFKNKTKISLLGSSNNINTKGFTNDEAQNLGGNTGSRGGNNVKGIQKSTTIGVNYSDQLSSNVDLESLGVTRNETNLETASKVSRTTFLPDSTLKTDSENHADNSTEQYNFNSAVKIRPDSLSTFYFSPKLSISKTTNVRNSKSITYKNDELLNDSESSTHAKSENNSFSQNLYYSKKFKKKGRSLYASLNTSISESTNDNLTKSATKFYQSSDPDDIRNQLSQSKNQNNNYSFNAKYSEPVSDSLNVTLGLNYNSKNLSSIRNINDFDENTGQYSNYNILLSKSSDQKNNQLSPEINIELNKKKYSVWASTTVNFSDLKYDAVFNGEHYNLQRNFTLPDYNAGLQYHISENSKLSIYNSASFTVPAPENVIPYRDESNPLITYEGNPDLKNTWSNRTSVYFNNFNTKTSFNYNVNLSFTYSNNDVTNFSFYDESGKQFVSYRNISGNKSATLGGSLGKTYKWNDNKLTIRPKANVNYRYNKGYINGQEFLGNSYTFTPGIGFTYDKKDKVNIKPSYNVNYTLSNYENYSVESIKNTYQTFRLELTNYFLKTNLIFENDFEYNKSSNITPGFKRDFYFWNTSIGYTFYKKQLTAKVRVYDILNQNQSVRRTISSSYVEDREDLILKRYIMFSLTLKLNKFTGRKI
ncbi:outer membrane beta-barrel protein [Chryseobacterium camelliae]|uniref:Outer membrane beta-barrel protein n=1 Tax=Chryseobacterium camelliae TaxID=1265445 RepID=A0ABY7QRN8_9FLAO|nr:outer membrane beta-barrel protein [Chryseobacterium camelliae]WBV61493.1 outer membrane beta-barrel protein [Chryseobacterium camelliae]